MAVYTQLGGEALAALIAEFDVGELVMAKGIAEGVSNSNWLLDTDRKSTWCSSCPGNWWTEHGAHSARPGLRHPSP